MYNTLKRGLDIFVSICVMLVLLPLAIPLLIGLKLTGEGKILYLQKRLGLKNSYFYIYKFATMLENSPNIGAGMITLRNDPRVTPMGGFLRKTKLNELPQVLNVLKGDISLVGPRPLVDSAFQAYDKHVQEVIYKVKPGITGIGSIAFRDEEKIISQSSLEPKDAYKQLVSPYKGALELWYQKNASMVTDLKIIFLTAWVIIFPNSDMMHSFFPSLPLAPNHLTSAS